mgnify:CR=1 FL=1
MSIKYYIEIEYLDEILNAYDEINNRKKITKADKIALDVMDSFIHSITSYSIQDLKVLLGIYKDKNTSEELKAEIKGIIFNLKRVEDIFKDWEKQEDINKPYFPNLPVISPYFMESFPSKTGDPITPYYQIVSTTIEPYYEEVRGKRSSRHKK